MSQNLIIGVSGTFASGKDTLANHLAREYNLKHISTSDLVRESALEKYHSTDRPILHKLANEMREAKGPGIFVKMAIDRAGSDPAVISGIRTIGEAEAIQAAGGKIVFIDAAPEIRYQRASQRKRDVEQNMSFEEFMASEEKELQQSTTDKSKFNILGIKDMADHVLYNNDKAEDLFTSVKEKLGFNKPESD